MDWRALSLRDGFLPEKAAGANWGWEFGEIFLVNVRNP